MSPRSTSPLGKVTSYGRGGAGNFRSGSISTQQDLTTPSIKSDIYTTGRGGQGNMAKNDPANPEKARDCQDVKPTPRRLSQGQTHYGRGGAANTIKMTPAEIARAREENLRIERAAREEDVVKNGPLGKIQSLADKGKEVLTGAR